MIGRASKNLVVELQMSRTMADRSPFRLRITDKASRLQLIEVDIDEKGFADFMSTRSAYSTANVTVDDRVGMVHENASVEIDVPDTSLKSLHRSMAEWRAANSGWVLDAERSFNRHRYSEGKYTVTARRWVEP